MLDRLYCRLKSIYRGPTQCDSSPPPEELARATPQTPKEKLLENIKLLKGDAERRAGMPGGQQLPDGQELPDWMSYITYITNIDDHRVTTGSIVDLPLTYYGPTRTLGEGWTYGGSTSPTSTVTESAATPLSSDSSTQDMTDSGSSSNSATTHRSSSRSASSSSSIAGSSLSGETVLSGVTDDSSRTSSTATSTLEQASSMSSSASPSVSHAAPSSTSGTFIGVSASSSTRYASSTTYSTLSSDTSQSTSATSAASATTSTLSSSHRNLLAPLLAVLIPFGVGLFIFLVLLFLYRRCRSHMEMGFFPWLFKPTQWAAVPAMPTTPRKASRSPELPTAFGTPIGHRTPSEKSALLPDFVAQHHRKSSSISGISSIENDDEMRTLVQQNQSLLQRLSLGLGFATPTPTSSDGHGGSRRTSGNTAEKGESTSRRIFSGAMAAAGVAGAAAAAGLGRTRSATQRTGGTTSTANHHYDRILEDDQLFYKAPGGTQSSSGSKSGSPSSSFKSKHLKGSRWMADQPPLPEGGPSNGEPRPSMTFSVSVPETPRSRCLSERDMDIAEFGGPMVRRNGDVTQEKERMRFPIPPGVGMGSHRDHHHASSSNGRASNKGTGTSGTTTESWYSANSHPPPRFNIPPPPPGTPLRRDERDYKHASLSVFGSVPATPTGETHDQHGHMSSSSQSQPEGVSPISRPSSPSKPERSPSIFGSPLRYPSSADRATPRSRGFLNDAIKPMKQLFSPTTHSSAGSKSKVDEDSFYGQPLVDATGLKSGNLRASRRGVGEFGEGLKTAQGINTSPTLVSHTGGSVDQSSKSASIHTANMSNLSHSQSGSSSGGHGTMLREVKEAQGGEAVRGKRSRAELVRASIILGQAPPVPPVPSAGSGPGNDGYAK